MSRIIWQKLLWFKKHKKYAESVTEYKEQECPDCLVYKDKLKQLVEALSESVKLQSHYAGLLNMHDEGGRMMFANSDEWLKRLKHLKESDSH